VRREKLDAILVIGEANVSYLTGFTGDSSYLLLGPDHELLISDFRYVTQLSEECPGLETSIRTSEIKLHEATIAVLAESGVKRLGVEGHLMSLELHGQLQEKLEGIEFVPQNSVIENELRAIKDATEIAELREAVGLAARGLEFLKALLTPDLTEREAAFELEHAVRRFGGAGLSFPAIIAVGDRAALPHYRPSNLRIGENPLLLVDWGVNTTGNYKSDLTRTLFTGKPTRRHEKVYRTVLKAQQAAIAAIRPGAVCQDVDAVARKVIKKAGYGKNFGHGLGHGIGLHIHEQPRFAPKVTTELVPGMVVTVEPGIYLPGWGGVRIEDDVLVTREGCEVLSQSVSTEFEDMLLV
jgi:Xaa-Pro aminopeptidase